MDLDSEMIDAMFAKHGMSGPWTALQSTGVANRIYATPEVVLRVATDHPDGVLDARTESVAAPVARAAGILTPRLIAFDDTRTLVSRPFSLWERVQGETLGLANLSLRQLIDVWRSVGRELARLHLRVRECADPDGFLDEPARDQNVHRGLKRLVDAEKLDIDTSEQVERFAEELRPFIEADIETRFVHDDIHPMNLMCSGEGELLAIIDWGDAGWGDPTLDFAAMPLYAVSSALDGYEAEAPGCLGEFPELRIAWNKVLDAIADHWDSPETPLDVDGLRRFVRSRVGGFRTANNSMPQIAPFAAADPQIRPRLRPHPKNKDANRQLSLDYG